jgi:hypothetical protein
MMTESEILLKAADLIDEKGLVKHTFDDPKTGSFCLVGAIGEVVRQEEGLEYVNYFGYPLKLAYKVHDNPIGFNDSRFTDKKRVVKRLRKTAKKLA